MVECNCILPQYAKIKPPIFHKFIVFSEITDQGEFVPSFAKCNNCFAIHKIVEVFQSKTIAKENVSSLPKEEELKRGLNDELVSMVQEYDPEIHVWQEIDFIVKNRLWGKTVTLTKENVDGLITGKFLLIAGKNLFKIDSFTVDGGEDEANE